MCLGRLLPSTGIHAILALADSSSFIFDDTGRLGYSSFTSHAKKENQIPSLGMLALLTHDLDEDG